MNNENKNNKYNKNIPLLIVVIILIILIGIAISFILLNNKEDKNDNPNDNNVSDNNEKQNGTNEDDDIVIKNIKINENEEYIYDATYSYDNKYTEYYDENEVEIRSMTCGGLTFDVYYGAHYLNTLKVPYININSEDANNVNKIMEELYINSAKKFDELADLVPIIAGGPNSTPRQVLDYKTYINKNILSIVVIEGSSTGVLPIYFQTYNFNLNNGKLLNYDELLNKLGYNKKTVLDNAKEIMQNNQLFKDKKYVDLEESFNNFEKLVNNNTILTFLNEDGNLCMIYEILPPAQVPSYELLEIIK